MTRTLRLLLDARDVEGVVPEAAANEVVAALDADAWSAWKAAGADVLPWPARASAQHIADEAFALWQAHASIEWRGCNLMEIVAYRHLRWISRAAWVVAAVQEAVERSRPDVVLLHAPRATCAERPHLLDLLPGEQSMPALGTLAEAAALACGATVTHVGSPEQSAHEAAAYFNHAASPAPSAPTRSSTSRDTPSLPHGHLLVLSDAAELHRHDAMLHALIPASAEHRQGRAVHVTHDAAIAATKGSTVAFPLLHQDVYAGPLGPAGPAREACTAALDALLYAFRAEQSSGAALLNSPGLRPHLSHLFGVYAPRVAAGTDRWRHALERHRPSAVVASYPCIALEIAARSGIPALLLPHGPMMTGAHAYHRLLPRSIVLGAAGRVHERVLLSDDIDAKRVIVTGCGSGAHQRSQPGKVPNHTRPLRVLIVVSGPVRPAQIGMLPAPDIDAEAGAVGDLVAAASKHQWHIVLRRHPRYACSDAFYRRLWPADVQVTCTNADQMPLHAAVDACDAVVCIGGPSSVIPEAALLGRPVWIVGSTLARGAPELWGIEDFPWVRDIDELIGMLERFQCDESAWRDVVERTARAGAEFLDSRPLTAARAVDQVIGRDMLSLPCTSHEGTAAS